MSFEAGFSKEFDGQKTLKKLNEYVAHAEIAKKWNEDAPGKVRLINEKLKTLFDDVIEQGVVIDDKQVARIGELIAWLNKREQELLQ